MLMLCNVIGVIAVITVNAPISFLRIPWK